MTEKQLQAYVLEAATLLGWHAYHTFDSRRSAAGFPDLVLLRPPRLLFAELKTERGRLTPEQAHWHDELKQVEHAIDDRFAGHGPLQAHVWRPDQWHDDTIATALR